MLNGTPQALTWTVRGPLLPLTEARLFPDPTSHLQPQQSPRLTSNPGAVFKILRHAPATLRARDGRVQARVIGEDRKVRGGLQVHEKIRGSIRE